MFSYGRLVCPLLFVFVWVDFFPEKQLSCWVEGIYFFPSTLKTLSLVPVTQSPELWWYFSSLFLLVPSDWLHYTYLQFPFLVTHYLSLGTYSVVSACPSCRLRKLLGIPSSGCSSLPSPWGAGSHEQNAPAKYPGWSELNVCMGTPGEERGSGRASTPWVDEIA